MKIINLRAENFKRIQAVDITPKDNVVVLSGANEQGKSSVLDAIMSALAGGRGMKDIPEPIRRGEDYAEVVLDLGDLVVKRMWELPRQFAENNPARGEGVKSRIEVTNADGMKYSSPQSILDALTGALTFDPLAFARMAPREQRAELLRLVDLPFDMEENNGKRTELVQKETFARKARSQAEDAVRSCLKPPEGTPDEEVSAKDLFARLQEMRAEQEKNDAVRAALREKRSYREKLERKTEDAGNGIAEAEDYIRTAQAKLDKTKLELESLNEDLKEAEKDERVAAAEAEALVDPDTSEVEERIRTLDEVNRSVRIRKEAEAVKAALADAKSREQAAKLAVADHDWNTREALAKAKYPVAGLGFDEDGVTLGGMSFSQASESQRILTSAAMGMAMNPRLKVMFIRDGSSLDSTRMAALSDMAAENDFQLWIEVVDETGRVGIAIEDGMVAAAGAAGTAG